MENYNVTGCSSLYASLFESRKCFINLLEIENEAANFLQKSKNLQYLNRFELMARCLSAVWEY